MNDPNMRPHGNEEACPLLQPIFQAITAKVRPNRDISCCERIPICDSPTSFSASICPVAIASEQDTVQRPASQATWPWLSAASETFSFDRIASKIAFASTGYARFWNS